MTRRLAAAVILLSLGAPAFAHRLDEYLQATIVSVERDHLQLFMRLIPGVAVSSVVLSSIDINSDGIVTEAEGKSYAERVLRDLSLTVNGRPLLPRVASVNLPKAEELKDGLGEIQIDFTAELPSGGGERKIALHNHHQARISAYMVNSLVSRDKNIQILAQNRNENQSFYELHYRQTGDHPNLSIASWPVVGTWLGSGVLLLATTLGIVARQRKKIEVTA